MDAVLGRDRQVRQQQRIAERSHIGNPGREPRRFV